MTSFLANELAEYSDAGDLSRVLRPELACCLRGHEKLQNIRPRLHAVGGALKVALCTWIKQRPREELLRARTDLGQALRRLEKEPDTSDTSGSSVASWSSLLPAAEYLQSVLAAETVGDAPTTPRRLLARRDSAATSDASPAASAAHLQASPMGCASSPPSRRRLSTKRPAPASASVCASPDVSLHEVSSASQADASASTARSAAHMAKIGRVSHATSDRIEAARQLVLERQAALKEAEVEFHSLLAEADAETGLHETPNISGSARAICDIVQGDWKEFLESYMIGRQILAKWLAGPACSSELFDAVQRLMLALLAYHLLGRPTIKSSKSFATKIFSYGCKFLLQDHLHLLTKLLCTRSGEVGRLHLALWNW